MKRISNGLATSFFINRGFVARNKFWGYYCRTDTGLHLFYMKDQQKTFTFKRYEINLQEGYVVFYYEVSLSDETIFFEEKLTFSSEHIILSSSDKNKITPILESLLLIIGISYWKLYCPEIIIIESFSLNKEQADFWNTVYTNGLGEFYFKNKIDFRKLVNFPYVNDLLNKSQFGQLRKDPQNFSQKFETRKASKTLLLYGGGKDSLVSAELLKSAGKTFSIYTLNEYSFQDKAIRILNADHIIVKRKLDSKLLDISKRKDIFEGHVPISLIYTFTAVFASVLYGYDYIVASNEESSSYGNVMYLGMEINHQWSKSLECEELVQTYIHNFIDNSITYFSLLRPLKEIKITELFSHYPQYFKLFVSCNRNFTVRNSGEEFSWCGKCPKCLFVFAMMSAFIPKIELIKIFGKNLFADPSLMLIYKELLGIENIKPFECVGTPEETQVAFYLAYKRGEYKNDVIMKMFSENFSKNFNFYEPSKLEQVEDLSIARLVPLSFKSVLNCLCQ